MRVLIIRLSSIGDIILTTQILRELKERYPNIVIDFLVLDRFKDSISDNPYIDNLIVFDKKRDDGLINMIKLGRKLRKNNYTYVYDLHSKLRSRVISMAIGSKTFKYKKRRLIKTVLVKLGLIRYSVDDTIIRNYYGAFKNLGLKYNKECLEFYFSKEDMERVESLKIDYKNSIAIAPGASKETKKWTKEGFAELISLIVEKYQKNIILIGSESEREMCEDISKLSGKEVVNLAGKLSLKESGALLSKIEFLICNDSAPFHIARGVNTPAFVIFGPTDPKMFEYDENSILIYLNENCSPCSLHGDKNCPKNDFKCMKNIKAIDVLKIIEKTRRL